MTGGKRKGAGRKPLKDKKKLVALYIRESIITKKGYTNLQEALTQIAEKMEHEDISNVNNA